MTSVLLIIHVFLCLGIIALVLIQRTDSDGMGGLSGGSMNMNSFLTGRAAANLLTRTTAILATAFFITSIALAYLGNAKHNVSIVDSVSSSEPSTGDAGSKSAPEAPSVPLAK